MRGINEIGVVIECLSVSCVVPMSLFKILLRIEAEILVSSINR